MTRAMRTMDVGGRIVGEQRPTFIIAEVGINHNGDVETARRLIEAAKRAGADAVKFQTYITEQRVPTSSPIYSVLKQCELSFKDQAALQRMAHGEGILFFSTPFDAESVSFLADLGVPAYKIASFDITNRQLIRQAAAVGRPLIMSRGMATAEEIDLAVAICEEAQVAFALLHCISAYPTPDGQANLRVIGALRQRYACPVGYSDHTLGIAVATYAVAAGAELLEKHFTLDRGMPGPDQALSADPGELAELVRRARAVEEMLGQAAFQVYEAERPTLAYRRMS